jgi:hypothetical protein
LLPVVFLNSLQDFVHRGLKLAYLFRQAYQQSLCYFRVRIRHLPRAEVFHVGIES